MILLPPPPTWHYECDDDITMFHSFHKGSWGWNLAMRGIPLPAQLSPLLASHLLSFLSLFFLPPSISPFLTPPFPPPLHPFLLSSLLSARFPWLISARHELYTKSYVQGMWELDHTTRKSGATSAHWHVLSTGPETGLTKYSQKKNARRKRRSKGVRDWD
jgi:hypothetical protein